MNLEKELREELALAGMMVKDLEKLWASYAKKALQAKQEREKNQAKRAFMECETKEELVDMYGYGDLNEDDYRRGLDYFDSYKDSPPSIIEQHRKNIREMLDRWRGTVKELQEELSPQDNQTENAFERLDRLEREERYKNMM